jgi:hypothetical protein
LYQKVYDQEEVMNNEICQRFARVVILESTIDRRINWAGYAAYCHERREHLALTKATNLEVKVEVQGQSLQSGVTWEVRKRCPLLSLKENVPSKLVKLEQMGCFRGKSSWKLGLRSPNWEETELSDLESILGEKNKLLETLKVSLEQSLSKKTQVEGECRRA